MALYNISTYSQYTDVFIGFMLCQTTSNLPPNCSNWPFFIRLLPSLVPSERRKRARWSEWAIEHWGFFNVPHQQWHRSTLYNGHLQGPVIHAPVPSFWQWSGHYLFLPLRTVATGNRTQISRMRGKRSTSTPPRRFTEWEMTKGNLSCVRDDHTLSLQCIRGTQEVINTVWRVNRGNHCCRGGGA